MKYILPMVSEMMVSDVLIVQTQSGVPVNPQCSDSVADNCAEDEGWFCQGGILNRFDVNFSVESTTCAGSLEELGCDITYNGTSLNGCSVSCTADDCTSGFVIYHVECPFSSGNPDCTQSSVDNLEITCDGPTVLCQDDSI